jgi:thioredoxin-dependent peroxiredoxin
MLKHGQKAPDFRLQTEAGLELPLADWKGKRALLFFFPKADTPG